MPQGFQGEGHGLDFYGGWRPAVARGPRACPGLCPAAGARSGGAVMMTSGWMILAAVLAVALLVYLVAVLLRPEDFS